MIISTPSGNEVDLKWAGRVGQWMIQLPNRNNAYLVNDAGLDWYFQQFGLPQKQDPHAKHRCALDFPWVCPFLKAGGYAPCLSRKKRDNQHLVEISHTDYEIHPRKRPKKAQDGQLLMFETEHYFLNIKTGKERICEPNDPRPYSGGTVVCKHYGVASMEWLKRNQGWSALKWRILPLDDDMQWINQQQIKYSGKYKSCVFDIWD